jgi:type IV pilus assembly protein PilC
VVIGDALRSVHHSVEKGEKVARPLSGARIFPPLVVDMISIGEETGTLDRMLDKIADIFDAEVDATLRGLATIIEPVLIVLLGGLVIFIALAVMLPYFNLVNVV